MTDETVTDGARYGRKHVRCLRRDGRGGGGEFCSISDGLAGLWASDHGLVHIAARGHSLRLCPWLF
jgi:hypothetical protein